MQIWLADPLFGGAVQNGRHLIELFAAFGLTTLIGLERTIQGKSAGATNPNHRWHLIGVDPNDQQVRL
jgi:hypothetical protein